MVLACGYGSRDSGLWRRLEAAVFSANTCPLRCLRESVSVIFSDSVVGGLGEGHGFQERAEDVRHGTAQATADGADPVAHLGQISECQTERQSSRT